MNSFNSQQQTYQIANLQKQTEQEIYDSFNNLVFSDDTRVMFKMITKN